MTQPAPHVLVLIPSASTAQLTTAGSTSPATLHVRVVPLWTTATVLPVTQNVPFAMNLRLTVRNAPLLATILLIYSIKLATIPVLTLTLMTPMQAQDLTPARAVINSVLAVMPP